MMQNGQNQQYPIENRKRQNKINFMITTGIIAGVTVITAGLLIMMALIGRPAQPEMLAEPEHQTPAVVESAVSETGSMEVSPSSEPLETKSEDASTVSEITLSGAPVESE